MNDGRVNGVVTVPGTDEVKVEAFTREDVQDTYPDGALLNLTLQDITDLEGKSVR